jgi:hypothetical protein
VRPERPTGDRSLFVGAEDRGDLGRIEVRVALFFLSSLALPALLVRAGLLLR